MTGFVVLIASWVKDGSWISWWTYAPPVHGFAVMPQPTRT
jgi:hypothetical protein